MDGEMQTGKRLQQAGAINFSHEDKATDKLSAKEHVKSTASEGFIQKENLTSRHSFHNAPEQAKPTYPAMSKEGETNATILLRLGQHEVDFAFPRKAAEKKSKKPRREEGDGGHGRLGLGLLSKRHQGVDRTGLQDPESDNEGLKDDGDSIFNFKNLPSFAR
jgi:hypothetical protein